MTRELILWLLRNFRACYVSQKMNLIRVDDVNKLNRRATIKLGAQAALALTAALPFISCASKIPTKKMEKTSLIPWNEFIAKVQELAKTQHKHNWNELTYTKNVSKVISTLDLADNTIIGFIQNYKNLHKNFPEINTLHKEADFMVSFVEFEAGEKIKLHDHPGMSGVIRCMEGRLNVQNYTLQEKRSLNNKLLLKQESSLTLTPGCTSTLTSTTGNIHSLQADTFSRLIDVFTPPYNDERSKNSRWYKKNSSYYQGIRGLFEADIIKS